MKSSYNLFVILILLLVIAAFPAWPYSTGWGYYPTGGLGSVLVLLIVLRVIGLI